MQSEVLSAILCSIIYGLYECVAFSALRRKRHVFRGQKIHLELNVYFIFNSYPKLFKTGKNSARYDHQRT